MIHRLSKHAPFIALLGALLAGCAAGPNPTLDRLRSAYSTAQQDPQISAQAPAALRDAGSTLARAERVWEQEKNAEEVEHLAYVTEQQIEIARAVAERKAAESEMAGLGSQLRSRDAELAKQRAARLEQELAEFKARETERGLMLTLGDVLFEVGSAELKPGIQRKLFPLADFLKETPGRNVLIEGHTDSSGSADFNLELSRRRAESVADFLIQQGVSPLRVTTRGYGEAFPVASNNTAAGRQQNRRVDVVILREGEKAVDRLRRATP